MSSRGLVADDRTAPVAVEGGTGLNPTSRQGDLGPGPGAGLPGTSGTCPKELPPKSRIGPGEHIACGFQRHACPLTRTDYFSAQAGRARCCDIFSRPWWIGTASLHGCDARQGMHMYTAFAIGIVLLVGAVVSFCVNADAPRRFCTRALLSFPPVDRRRIIRRIRDWIVVIATLILALSLGLAAADRYPPANDAREAESDVLADLGPPIEHALRELASGDRRLSEDPVLLPAALTTASGLKEDGKRLDEDLRSLDIWAAELARLDQRLEKSLTASRADELSKSIFRRQWASLKRKWDDRLRCLRDAHLEWIDAVTSVHLFMEERLGRTSIDGESVVFETDDETRQFNKLMQRVAVAAQGIVTASRQYEVAMKAVIERAS